jgi:hypothetical protein
MMLHEEIYVFCPSREIIGVKNLGDGALPLLRLGRPVNT